MLRWLLAPFALLYLLATALRNYLYDSGYFPSHEFDRTVISVGNLNVGGSGKTPMTEFLIEAIGSRLRVATLSRGYGRNSRGFRGVTALDTAATVGDEPLQMFRKFGSRVSVFVGEDRALAIPAMLAEDSEIQVILLDDAFQHRAVRPQVSILVTDCAKPFYADAILPVGRLRESRHGAARADIVVLTKCPPDLTAEWRGAQTTAVRQFAGNKPVLFSSIKYLEPVGFGSEKWQNVLVVAVTGIAQFQPFLDYARAHFTLHQHLCFPDHHPFSEADLRQMLDAVRTAPAPAVIITTEKDYMRLQPHYQQKKFHDVPCFYIPIKMFFSEEDAAFLASFLTDRMPALQS